MQPVKLVTDRLVLSPLVSSDIAQVTRMCSEPDIQEWTTVPQPYTSKDGETFVETLAPADWEKDSPIWAIRLRENEERETNSPHIGTIAITSNGTTGDIGFLLGREYTGEGFMTEAVQAVLDFGFSELGLQAIHWRCEVHNDEPNWPSAAVAWRSGFTFEGKLSRQSVNKGKAYDCIVASILPGDAREPQHAWPGPNKNHPAIGNSRDPEQLVRVFHETYGLPIFENAPDAAHDRIHMRLGLVVEECCELVGAAYGPAAQEEMTQAFERARKLDDGTRDTVEVADAIGDSIYVLYGMALELGIPIADVLAEIQASNLSKLGADGKPIYRADGKVLKGPNYFRPNLRKVLGLR